MIESEEIKRMLERLEQKRAGSVARARALMGKAGEARRWKIELIRGTVRSIVFSPGGDGAELDVDGGKTLLKVVEGAIQIAEGDTVLLAGRTHDPFQATLYYNETTGAGSLESTRKAARYLLIWGWLGVLAATAILTTVVLAAWREPAFLSGAGALHILLYLVAIAAAGLMIMLSLLSLSFGISERKMRLLAKSVASGDSVATGAPD